ncbi:uncharacterized protein PAC_10686 [Phialocephala subalpina]|uniref:Myb-like domain-containing protein n=1 Tax=Phialocephala subalpina TaxID=576137 RepID=A0A1L7X6Y5_9HELO|nr:uncharacterized protein PAC_10686 [Phialocephala subalpina]
MPPLSPALSAPASPNTRASRTPYFSAGTRGYYPNPPLISHTSSYAPILPSSKSSDEQHAKSRSAAYANTSPRLIPATTAFTQQSQAYAAMQNAQSFTTPLHPMQHPLSLHPTPTSFTPAQATIRESSIAWNPQDDATLMAARAQGMNWAPIHWTYFPSKTPNACRKRHERLMERRNVDDWDGIKIENLAKHYMAMRREIWAPLAAATGEKWSVVEQKCMSQGLKNLQTPSRSCSGRERILESYDAGVLSPSIDSGYADDMETQGGYYEDSESTRGHEDMEVFHNRYHSQLYTMNSVQTAPIPSSRHINPYSDARAYSPNQTGTISTYLAPQKADSIDLNEATKTSNNFHHSIAPTWDSAFEEMPKNDNRLLRTANEPIESPGTRAALVEDVPSRKSSIYVNQGPNVQLPLRTSTPEQTQIVTTPAAGDEDPRATVGEESVILVKESDIQAKSSPRISNSKPIQACEKSSTDSHHSDQSNDDENSLISWEDRIDIENGISLSPEAKNKFDIVMSLMAALRYRLLSELMLSFHLRCKQSSIDIKWQSADSPTGGHDTSPSNPAAGDASTPDAPFTARGNSGGVPTPSSATHSNPKRGADQDGDEDDETHKKRQRRDPQDCSPHPEKHQRLICPYRHRDPGSFGLNGARVCANTWPDIAKLKEHLYRKHYVKFQCQRCKENLRSRLELDSHAEAKVSCLPRIRELKDGFTFETYEWLRNKKNPPGQIQQEKWRAMYDHLFASDTSLLASNFDNLDHNGSSILANNVPISNTSLDLLENYLPYAEAIVARRMKPVETSLLEQVLGPDHQFQAISLGSTQSLNPSSVHGCESGKAKIPQSPADSGFGAYVTPMPSIETSQTPRAMDDMDFGVSLSEHNDFDALLNSCFSPYMVSQLPPAQYLDQEIAYNFCSTCVGHCVCQGRTHCESKVPGNSNPSAQSSSNNASMIQQLMQRIEALEKKPEVGYQSPCFTLCLRAIENYVVSNIISSKCEEILYQIPWYATKIRICMDEFMIYARRKAILIIESGRRRRIESSYSGLRNQEIEGSSESVANTNLPEVLVQKGGEFYQIELIHNLKYTDWMRFFVVQYSILPLALSKVNVKMKI